ncbi:MAG: ABC transporter permease [Akkermansiaceae bacterium]|nr:ABC transporter permease [Akkermansiaceae bacterium]
MKSYFLRRLLLIPPTLFGITLLVFLIVRLAPGGPVQRDVAQMMGASGEGQGGGGSRESTESKIKPAQIFEIEERHQRDKGVWRSYLEWLGVLPTDVLRVARSFEEGEKELKLPIPGTIEQATITRVSDDEIRWEVPEGIDRSQWRVRLVTVKELRKRWKRQMRGTDFPEDVQARVVLYRPSFEGLLQGSLGRSDKYGDPVWSLVKQRIPISLFYGIISMILIYSICLPLGVIKAIKHRSWIDTYSSVAVFAGYAVPGYVLGAFLLVFLGARLDLLPIQGFVSENFSELSLGEQVIDLIRHAIMPLSCYLVGSFAFMTFMMKNNLMDNLAADYVRTAAAKGVPFRTAVFRHAFRNSIIPIATTFGQNITLIVSGSFLIEKIFDINGFGLLQFNAVIEKDERVVLGVLTISAALMLIGNILSDLCVAAADPRIRFK